MINRELSNALDNFTDTVAFEKLSYHIMKERYPNIEKVGGVQDKGKDAQEEIHYVDNSIFHRRFQFSIEKNIKEKIRKTIQRYRDEDVEWDELVYVTNQCVQTIEALSTWFQQEYNKKLIIHDQDEIENVLIKNPILCQQYFPNIQIYGYTNENRLTKNQQLHENILKCALLYASRSNDVIKSKRNELFEQFILSLALTAKKITSDDVSKYFCTMFHKVLPTAQFIETIERLVEKRLLFPMALEQDSWRVTEDALSLLKENQKVINDGREKLINEIFIEVKQQQHDYKISKEEETRIKTNIKNVLNKFFQLYGTDFAIKIDQKILTEFKKQEILQKIAGVRINSQLVDTILYSIGKIIEQPTDQQRHTLSLLSKAYICAQIMQIDPLLSDCQTEILKDKIFILDTDVVLHSIVQESDNYNLYQQLITNLIQRGCKVSVPQAIINEVIVHAESSYGNYKRFKASYSTGDKSTLKEDYRNVFVDGFFAANGVDELITFDNYMSNYYDKQAPLQLMLDVMSHYLPSGVIIGNDETWIGNINIPQEEINRLSGRLYDRTLDTTKAEYRTNQGNESIANTDALIYLTAYHMSGNSESSGMLSQPCYVVTTSTRTIRCAKDVNLFKSVVTKPLIIISILEELGMFDAGYDTVDLLGNPFLAKIASDNWDDLAKLAQLGVDLRGKKIPRLLLDLKNMIHTDLTCGVDSEIGINNPDSLLDPSPDSMQEYINLVNSIENAGYKMMPIPQQIIKEYRAEIQKNEQKDVEIANLKQRKKKKERNKQRYETKYATNKRR